LSWKHSFTQKIANADTTCSYSITRFRYAWKSLVSLFWIESSSCSLPNLQTKLWRRALVERFGSGVAGRAMGMPMLWPVHIWFSFLQLDLYRNEFSNYSRLLWSSLCALTPMRDNILITCNHWRGNWQNARSSLYAARQRVILGAAQDVLRKVRIHDRHH
jgi:hypothetical protein